MPSFPRRNRFVVLQMTVLVILLASCTSSIPSELYQDMSTENPQPIVTQPLPEDSARIQARIPLPPRTGSVTFGGGFIWVSNPAERSVLHIDASTGQVSGSPIRLEFEPREIAYGEGAIWVLSTDRTSLARIDLQSNKVIKIIDLSAFQIPSYNLVLIAAGEGAVWITDQTSVIQINPQTNEVVGQSLPAGEEII